MSFSYQLQMINQSFERIASWYHEFMRRTELCFRKMNERILRLEQKQLTHGPTDEQVERVLRKILAERFAPLDMPQVKLADHTQSVGWFVQDPNEHLYPRSIKMDVASLLVSPESVPSRAYAETFQMLEDDVNDYPGDDLLMDEDEDQKIYLGHLTSRPTHRV
ncbi:hypothetical protein COCMIDRAFT_107768 [Bipolaris oryzae ATCC 44560]|uniref:Uncharacterized protein n=1 Tax=Bipolaris oryzae ATCC 44560 TaxID=930090 RepID=W6YZ77_COCMI|nr:uncharacterized protein COCMIDRAFT_107768 [Bipolaris oryzae ATCC 44560]EUC40844.1 hypothetical protein COCMIDRAFT_107768 [Bipolaris oryzae ATCC 44560]